MKLFEVMDYIDDDTLVIYLDDEDIDDEFIIEGDFELLDDEEVLDEVMRRGFAIRGGQKVRIKVTRRRAGRISIKKRRALRRARIKSRTGSAKRHRKISVRRRKQRGVRKVKGGNRPKSRHYGGA